jgi:hypothetical protein
MIVLAFWRTNGVGETEFFVPFNDYMDTMRHIANGNPSRSARRSVANAFGGLNPRSNARVIQLPLGCIVAFTLTSTEALSVSDKGNWLPIVMMDPLLGAMLQDVAARL